MRSNDADILFVPGLGNSGPNHWQTRWEAKLSTARRVEQDDWETPKRIDWAAHITAAVDAAERPVVIIAHSLGCVAVAYAAPAFQPGLVKGALLVAPASARWIEIGSVIDPAFAPIPIDPLPSFPLGRKPDRHPCKLRGSRGDRRPLGFVAARCRRRRPPQYRNPAMGPGRRG